MGLSYDMDVFNHYRSLAVTSIDKLIVGNEYYSNAESNFVVRELITRREMYKRWDQQLHLCDNRNYDELDDSEIAYIEGQFEDGDIKFLSLHDLNVIDSYNPWMIFDNEDIKKECQKNLIIENVRNPFDFDDWATEYDPIYEDEFENDEYRKSYFETFKSFRGVC